MNGTLLSFLIALIIPTVAAVVIVMLERRTATPNDEIGPTASMSLAPRPKIVISPMAGKDRLDEDFKGR